MFNFGKKSKDTSYSKIYNQRTNKTEFQGECICCHNKTSVEKEDGFYYCTQCHMTFAPEVYESWLNGETVEFDYDNGTYFFDPDKYAIAYDEEGEEVIADCCGVPIMWDDENYVCPECGRIFSREEFFNMIGANPPGNLCVDCDQLYPCTSCHRGYEIEDDF